MELLFSARCPASLVRTEHTRGNLGQIADGRTERGRTVIQRPPRDDQPARSALASILASIRLKTPGAALPMRLAHVSHPTSVPRGLLADLERTVARRRPRFQQGFVTHEIPARPTELGPAQDPNVCFGAGCTRPSHLLSNSVEFSSPRTGGGPDVLPSLPRWVWPCERLPSHTDAIRCGLTLAPTSILFLPLITSFPRDHWYGRRLRVSLLSSSVSYRHLQADLTRLLPARPFTELLPSPVHARPTATAKAGTTHQTNVLILHHHRPSTRCTMQYNHDVQTKEGQNRSGSEHRDVSGG
jgi:hypothetical protein